MKIGAINFEDELEVLRLLRNDYRDLILRVDANGAFDPDIVMEKLEVLAKYNIHSIEQPIPTGNWKFMRELCKISPIPVALDEELIGMGKRKEELIEAISPQYIVLKPTLLGGFKESLKWIEIAENNNIGWWITSMLESNIGLNAITQFAAQIAPATIHGLGTGQLYSNNIDSPLRINKGHISYIQDRSWDYYLFDSR